MRNSDPAGKLEQVSMDSQVFGVAVVRVGNECCRTRTVCASSSASTFVRGMEYSFLPRAVTSPLAPEENEWNERTQ
jgi:hypothetical protein